MQHHALCVASPNSHGVLYLIRPPVFSYVPKKLQASAGVGDPVEELDARIARLREEEERQKEEKVCFACTLAFRI